jgi:hypothetical protein
LHVTLAIAKVLFGASMSLVIACNMTTKTVRDLWGLTLIPVLATLILVPRFIH